MRTNSLAYPRIGSQRELKNNCEKYLAVSMPPCIPSCTRRKSLSTLS